MTRKGLNQSAQSSSPKWAKIATAAAVALALPSTHAVGLSWGEWEGSFDTTLSVGMSWRAEKRDPDLVGRANWNNIGPGGVADLPGTNTISPGGWSNNGDDGNQNFHQWDTFSKVIKATHDFGMRHSSGVGFFMRGAWFYDFEINDEDRRFKELSDQAKDIHGTDVRMLDAYIYHTWEFDESALQVRFGEQVVNWGESTFIQHSISEANPIDVTKLRVPGAELKEAFLPVQTLWASMDITPNLTLETYVQFEWEAFRTDEAGTYFASTDFAGEQDSGDIIHLGFAQYGEGTPGTTARRLADDEARDSGQFGVKLGWYAEDLGGTEFGFYYINYHNKRPVISANKWDINAGGVTGQFQYLEDIELYGISFNTATDGGLSIAGEVSYRVDEPLQVDDVELLFAALEGVSLPRGLSQLNVSAAAGEQISGYRLFDTIQGQVTLTDLLGPGLGASQWTVLAEIGFNQIQDMPDQDVLRFEAPGTSRSGNQDRAGRGTGFFAGSDPSFTCVNVIPGTSFATECEGVETNPFADDFSWGYRLVVKADYLDVFGGWNMSPRIVFQHDVSGTTPAPISNFVEGRKAVALGFAFDKLQQYKIDFAYNAFMGAGTANRLGDRDFVALTASYSF